MHYFSYGSNMSSKRLVNRVPSAKKMDTGLLQKHQLAFHKVSNVDGTAKCDALETRNPQHCIYGVLYDLDPKEKTVLDHIEGLGKGYEIKNVQIQTLSGPVITAFTYYATNTNPQLKPLDWYKEHVLRGAIENDLPSQYIQTIEKVISLEDPNIARRTKELSIYQT